MSDLAYLLRCGVSAKKAKTTLKELKKAEAPKDEEMTEEQKMEEASRAMTTQNVDRICNGSAMIAEPAASSEKVTRKSSKKGSKVTEAPEDTVQKTEVTPTGVSTEAYDAKCAEAQKMAREIEDLKNKISELQDENRKLEKNNTSLRTTISNTSRNSRNTDVTQLKTRIETLESTVTNLQHEVDRYKMIVETEGIDTRNISARASLFAMMTSPTTLNCVAFENGRYTVQFGSRFRVVRFVPDENGAVECTGGSVDLSALSHTHFPSLKKLSVTVTDGVITVTA